MTTTTHIPRYFIRRDFDDILAIERDQFGRHAWSDADLTKCLRQRNVVCLCLDIDDALAAYVVYSIHPKRIDVYTIAAAREHERTGLASVLINRLNELQVGTLTDMQIAFMTERRMQS